MSFFDAIFPMPSSGRNADDMGMPPEPAVENSQPMAGQADRPVRPPADQLREADAEGAGWNDGLELTGGETTMGTFTTKLTLGGKAFAVCGDLDPTVRELTVGQIRVFDTLPSVRLFNDEPCYREEYMCLETGVGSGTLWQYGKNIFATEEDAQAGVIARQKETHKRRAERDARLAEAAELQRQDDLLTLKRLKLKYETPNG